MLFLPIGLCTGWCVKNWDAIRPQTNSEEAKITVVIEKAVTYQFAAFKAIPNYQSKLASLQEVYVSKGSAYQDITSILMRQSNLNWTISNTSNPSTAQLINVTLDSIRNDQAFVTTIEHWRLDWFNQASQRDEYKYCLLYTSPSPRDATLSRMPSSA